MDAIEIVMSYLFEMWMTEQGAELTREDLDVLIDYLEKRSVIKISESLKPSPIPGG